MGTGPAPRAYLDYEAAEKAEALKRAHEGKEARPTERGPPPGDGVMIEHNPNERPRYVPKSLRSPTPRR